MPPAYSKGCLPFSMAREIVGVDVIGCSGVGILSCQV